MTAIPEFIADLVENPASGLRRAVQAALSLAAENGAEHEVLQRVEARSSVGARWLCAALTERTKGVDIASPLWERVVAQTGCEIPDVLLHRARNCARAGHAAEAASLLRIALDCSLEHDFFLRSEALVRKCRHAFGCVRKTKIAILGSTTTTFLRNAIDTLCLRDRIEAEFYEPLYGTYAQELIDPKSQLCTFRPDFVVLLLNWRDLGLDDTDADVEPVEYANRVISLWQAALTSTSAFVIQFAFTPPADDPYHALSSSLPSGKTRMVRRINEELHRRRPDRVALVDAERMAAASAVVWEDPLLWSSAAVYPAAAAVPMAAAQVVSLIRAELGLSRKLLLLDLDNTLWGGVIGEDGLGGIKLGAPSAIGARYKEFHRYLKNLTRRGVLLAVVSKNNAEDAESVFRRHDDCVLRLDDFVAFKANWNDKAANIRAIAAELRLGIDSFVFLDDNPSERSAVRASLPQTVVPEVSGDPADSIAALERGLYFQAVRLTEEDRARHASYLAAGKQAAVQACGKGVEQYLADLAMEIEYGPLDTDTIARVTQLINKTNQFNLTTHRYSQREVQLRINSASHWSRWYKLRDRFADHGLIAVMLVDIVATEWIVDTWLMSCRAIGRGVEEFMFRDLIESAHEAGATTVCGSYIPTAKNQLVADLLPKLGFVPQERPNEYALSVELASIPECRFLHPRSVERAASL